MMKSMSPAVLLLSSLCAGGAYAQTLNAPTDDAVAAGTSAPAAYVYVQNVSLVNKPKSGGKLYAYAAAANGHLTPISGSPLNFNVSPQGHSAKYLFGMEPNNTTIDTFLIGASGSLQKVDSLNTIVHDTGTCGNPGFFSLDRSASKLYNVAYTPDCGAVHPETVQSYAINGSNGQLGYLGDTTEVPGSGDNIAVLGNNNFSFMPTANFETAQDFGFATYKRLSNGFMQHTSNQFLLPTGSLGPESIQPGATYFWPQITATDSSNHVIAVLREFDGDVNDFGEFIAVYSADSNGILSTNNTFVQLVQTPEYATALEVSPSSKLVAVATGKGLVLLHLNGANAATSYKKVLTGQWVRKVSWDNQNHLFAIVESAAHPGTGKLHVYTATPTSFVEAPGSPYSVPNPEALEVVAK